jgi:hypothetical protein
LHIASSQFSHNPKEVQCPAEKEMLDFLLIMFGRAFQQTGYAPVPPSNATLRVNDLVEKK